MEIYSNCFYCYKDNCIEFYTDNTDLNTITSELFSIINTNDFICQEKEYINKLNTIKSKYTDTHHKDINYIFILLLLINNHININRCIECGVNLGNDNQKN